ncbi:MAG: K+/H+ antiporter subunit F [Sterolibacterium sp.]|nr:K+/H+ antiporter subunit F [Sterolibacterium sp.]
MNPATFLTLGAHFTLICLALAMLCSLLRLWRGPAVEDRVLALDGLTNQVLLTILSLGILWLTTDYFEMALLLALFGFLGSAALARFLLRGEVIEP